jgi:hypothetical protein
MSTQIHRTALPIALAVLLIAGAFGLAVIAMLFTGLV